MKIHVVGYETCGAFRQARSAVEGVSVIFPDKVTAEIQSFATRDEYFVWLDANKAGLGAPDHRTSPIVWFDEGRYLGGRDDTLAWCRQYLSAKESVISGPVPNVDPWNPEHGFDYDLIVIGGGSGGLACSKEAQKQGARVAVLDFVKPSPQGSKWGLGGTCVNVGCIPKKLMHTAALLGEHAHHSDSYGWQSSEKAVHNWEVMKNNVQDHIKGLNFGYRVSLREAGVTYLNKLGTFVGPNTLRCVDAKGKEQMITAARFVVAVGGRPTPLDCPGGEHAISSDDIFMKETAPGRTLVVGAGYVALECGGFINGLRQGEVVILVRSVCLRGFDREVVAKVQTHLTAQGVRVVEGATPVSIEKQSDGKLRVTFSNGEVGDFDTVLAAVGRYADTRALGLDAIGVEVSPRTGKIICRNEQSSVPHVYAIGDVVEGAPELTPVAILAGRLLARRLFGGRDQLMVYTDVATAVFTPLEMGTVGLSEEEAISKYGASSVDCYVSSFTPLEWSVPHIEETCIAKIVVNVNDGNKVLGLHIACPNAGEIIQGFAVAFRKGLSYQDLIDTVGIHPTVAEEFTVMEITKSSGKDTQKAGC